MTRLRLLLALLLCLTLSMTGWAAAFAGPPDLSAQDLDVPAAAAAQHHDGVSMSSAQHGDDGDGDHCADGHGHGCKDGHCDCGCGMGACSHAGLNVLPAVGLAAPYGGAMQLFLPWSASRRADPHLALLLRPPIA